MSTHSKYWNRMVDSLDENFPKGECKERGAAMVMLAEIESMLRADGLVEKSPFEDKDE